MSFTLPDLVIEGAVRKGFDFLRENAGTSPTNFMNIADVSEITDQQLGLVYSGTVGPAAGTFFNGILRFPNVLSFLQDGSVLEFTRAGNFSFRLDSSVQARGDLIQSGSGSDVFVEGTISFTGTPILNNGFLEVPFGMNVTSGSSSNVFTATSDFVSFSNNSDPITARVTWVIPGTRSGIEIIGAGGEVLDMLFNFETGSNDIDGGLDSSVSRKYTQEPLRLREFFRNNEVAIVQSFSDVQTNLPCISIQLANDGEDQGLALTDDFGGIDGTFDSDVPASDRLGRDENTIHANTVINVGIHTKDQLLTKYIYHITKYFILSAKEDLIRQNFIIATFKGSDFSRDAGWAGDHVYTRFLNISGKTEDSWINLDEIVVQLEEVGVQIFVPQDGNNNTFINGSPIFSNILTGAAQIQLANSVYFPDIGMAVLIQRDGTGAQRFQSTTAFSYTNDKNTGILSSADFMLGNDLNIVPADPTDPTVERTIEVRDVATGATLPVTSLNPTVTTPPASGLVQSQSRQNINDADDVLHRSNVNEGTI